MVGGEETQKNNISPNKRELQSHFNVFFDWPVSLKT